ncbi:MAG TPA: acid phosphatase [Casimicrobiaceae bacterium]|nr:acid phosphatase [Casimicrobiaceae bacterium]
MNARSRSPFALAFVALLLAACAAPPEQPQQRSTLDRIDNIVVIYAENRSFDHLYGLFPGAEGIASATPEQFVQLDHDGKPMATLPAVWGADGKADARFPRNLPNRPFRIDAPPVNMRLDQVLPSPIHQYWQNQEQIAGGRNNHFAAMTTVGGWVMGYFDGSSMKMWQWAREYTLADHFFMGAFGGSFLNHFWLVCACTPEFRDAPAKIRAQVEPDGRLKRRPGSPPSALNGPVQLFDGQVTPDGYAVNTSQPSYQPSGVVPAANGDRNLADPAGNPVPPQTQKTIGDTLSAKGVSWVWYAGAWNAAVADGRQDPRAKRAIIYNRTAPSPNFQPHHQPFNYFARFAPGTADRAAHLKDYEDLVHDIDAGTLPRVTFYKPAGRDTEHPSYTDVLTGDVHIAALLERLRRSPQWGSMLIVVTYDENGGFWDHVAPPSGPGWGDRWGPGTRIPAMVIGPFVKKGYIDKTSYDTTSIAKLITRRFGLEPLPGVRANAGDLTNALQ